jgi:hypothetical protein
MRQAAKAPCRVAPVTSTLGRMTSTTVSVEAFRDLASQFCAWCEGPSLGPNQEVAIAAWLARLHAAALCLPEAEPDNEEGLPSLPAEKLATVERNFSPFNGYYYRVVFDPDPTNTEEPVVGDVGDDLLDTYKDVKAGCVLSEGGRVQEALWHWAYMHRLHWGQHVVGALSALHATQRRRED